MPDWLADTYVIGMIVTLVIGWGFIIYDEWQCDYCNRRTGQYSEWAMCSVMWFLTVPFLIGVCIYLKRTDGRAKV